MQKVIVASQNPVKIEVAKRAFGAIFPNEEFEYIGVKSESGVPDQPFGEETRVGAMNRLAYIKKMHPGADWYISQEGGLHYDGDKIYNRAWIVAEDKTGAIGESSTASFYIPTKVAEYVRAGDELGTADDKFFGAENSKQSGGGIGFATDGLITRADYYLHAAIVAVCQVIHKEWYQ